MGQSTAPLLSRVGASQLWDFSQQPSWTKSYFARSIRHNRLLVKLLQLYFIAGIPSRQRKIFFSYLHLSAKLIATNPALRAGSLPPVRTPFTFRRISRAFGGHPHLPNDVFFSTVYFFSRNNWTIYTWNFFTPKGRRTPSLGRLFHLPGRGHSGVSTSLEYDSWLYRQYNLKSTRPLYSQTSTKLTRKYNLRLLTSDFRRTYDRALELKIWSL